MRLTPSRQVIGVVGVSFLMGCTSCASLSSIDSPYQRNLTSAATHAVLRSRLAARGAADKSPNGGALIFIEPTARRLKYSLPGDSPIDAWLRYAATSKATKVEDLPLPSSITPVAAFVPKATQAGTAQLIYTADLDTAVKEHYDLSSAILRFSAAIQQLRDVTVLLSLSDKKQNADIKRISDEFGRLGKGVEALAVRFGQLSGEQHDANTALESQLRSLSDQLDDLQSQIAKIK